MTLTSPHTKAEKEETNTMATVNIALAQVKQESNTFSPVLCELNDFLREGLYFGEEIIEHLGDKGEIGGFMERAKMEQMDFELFPILRARSTASGRIKQDVFEFFVERLKSGLEHIPPIDMLFLTLHGAAASEKEDDVEGALLQAARTVIGEQVPIVATFDHHANITRRIIENTTILVGYETQPHDLYGTGKIGADVMFSLLRGEYSPTVAWHKIPMVAPQDNFRTAAGPMKEWFDLARELEREPGVIKISLFPMQPWLDVLEAGWTTVVYTDNDPSLARRLSARLAEKAWELREAFWQFSRVAPEEIMKQVAEASEGPILVSDIADTVLGGAPGDSTCLLSAMLKQSISFPVLLPMYDPEVVDEAFAVGEGATLTTAIGGKKDNVFSKPVKVTGTVGKIAEGICIDIKERPYRRIKRGRTVILQVGSITILVGEDRGIGGVHPAVYRFFGINPEEAKMIVVKTGGNFQYFLPMSKDLILSDCPGMGQSDLRKFQWVRAPRPLYPIDSLEGWKAE